MEVETTLTKTAVDYLGVRLDLKLFYWKKIEYASDTVAHITAQLSKLMTNIGGPAARKTRLLVAVTESSFYMVAISGPMH